MLKIGIQFFALQGRRVPPRTAVIPVKRLGCKRADGGFVLAGNILVRQKRHPSIQHQRWYRQG